MADNDTLRTVRKIRIQHLQQAVDRGEKITMLTAYDTPSAQIFDEAGIDVLLVGDSIGDNMLGYHSTVPVTMADMLPAVRAVALAAKRALVVADLPFGSYEASPQQAFESATTMMKAGAHAVKFEGGARVCDQVRLLSSAGIPVMGHLGLTPQSEHTLGGKRVQGRGDEAAEQLCNDALALQEAGAFALVIELVPASLGARLAEILHIPVIGIGAGGACDGQVLVWLDMAGLAPWSPRFAKAYAHLRADLRDAALAYAEEVRSGAFPDPEHSIDGR